VSAQSKLGGGVLLELSHEIDYLRWIFGEVVWVKATLSRQSNLDIDVEDSVNMTLGFLSGPHKSKLIGVLNLDFIRHDTTRICMAIGEKGTLRWNGVNGVVDLFQAGATDWCELFSDKNERDESYRAEWKNFIECVTKDKDPLISGEDGLKALEIIEAAKKSSLIDEKVFITPFQNLGGVN